jgi:hypothetical protein
VQGVENKTETFVCDFNIEAAAASKEAVVRKKNGRRRKQ